MKTKMSLIILLLTICFSAVSAQQTDEFPFTVSTAKKLDPAIRSKNSNNIIDLSDINGSPYEKDAFSPGKAVTKNINNSKAFLLRYNIYNDVIEIQDEKNLIGLIKSTNIYAIINGVEYHCEEFKAENNKTKKGYFILLSKGENISLFLRKTKDYKEPVQAKTSFHKNEPAAFIDSESYYFKKGNEMTSLSQNKKKILQQFPEQEDELNSYLKKEKINLKSEKDLIKLFSYLDSVLK